MEDANTRMVNLAELRERLHERSKCMTKFVQKLQDRIRDSRAELDGAKLDEDRVFLQERVNAYLQALDDVTDTVVNDCGFSGDELWMARDQLLQWDEYLIEVRKKLQRRLKRVEKLRDVADPREFRFRVFREQTTALGVVLDDMLEMLVV